MFLPSNSSCHMSKPSTLQRLPRHSCLLPFFSCSIYSRVLCHWWKTFNPWNLAVSMSQWVRGTNSLTLHQSSPPCTKSSPEWELARLKMRVPRQCSKMCVFEGVEVAQIDIRHIYIILDSLQFQTISIYVLSSRCIIMMIDDSYVSLLYVCKCVIDCVWGNSIHFFARNISCTQSANANAFSLYALPMPRDCTYF